MKITKNFSYFLEKFFQKYLVGELGTSSHTIRSYRDTFLLLMEFAKDKYKLSPEKIKLETLSKTFILDFLDWLEDTKGNAISTRNVRLAALRSFFRFLSYEDIEHLDLWNSNLGIKCKKCRKETVKHLTKEGISAILDEVPTTTKVGRRHLVLLSLLYETGARVQEVITLAPKAVRLSKPFSISLLGKGNKTRIVPLTEHMAELLRNYYLDNHIIGTEEYKLFQNHSGIQLTSQGVTHILQKYAKLAHEKHSDDVPLGITPHVLRHSRAMHLLQAGVNLVYIRDFLGHASVQTTEIYARADLKAKREAIEKVSLTLTGNENLASWERNPDLKAYLKGLA